MRIEGEKLTQKVLVYPYKESNDTINTRGHGSSKWGEGKNVMKRISKNEHKGAGWDPFSPGHREAVSPTSPAEGSTVAETYSGGVPKLFGAEERW